MKKATTRGAWFFGIAALTTAVALPLAIGDNDPAAVEPTTTATAATSEESIAPEVEALAQEELEGDELTFAPGVDDPSPVDLIPELDGASVEEQSDSTLTLEADADNTAVYNALEDNQLDPDSTNVTVHVTEGDLAVSEAIYWQCGWIDEYLDAAQSGDEERMAAAQAQLETFPTLDAITTYAPDFVDQHQTIVVPMLDGDLSIGQYWLNTSCQDYTGR